MAEIKLLEPDQGNTCVGKSKSIFRKNNAGFGI